MLLTTTKLNYTMVVPDDDRASQILVLPASAEIAASQQARGLIETIIGGDSQSDASAASSSSRIIPWHIANRYYEADVHFRIADTSLLPPKSAQRTSNRRLVSRQARLIENPAGDNSHSRGQSRSPAEDDAALAARVRDVFEALEQNSSTSSTQGASHVQELTEHRIVLAKQLSGVQAVAIIVDREEDIEEHRRLLTLLSDEQHDGTEAEEGARLLSGFDLAVSLVIALPSIKTTEDGGTSIATDGIEELYAGEGWEYVDLARDDFADGKSTGDVDEEDDDEKSGLAEAEGIERIREALMTHTWPGLIQASGRKRGMQATSDAADSTDGVADTLAQVRLNLNQADIAAGATEPTQRDEELAAAFLARVNAANVSDEASSSQTAPAQSYSDMQAALERFLEEEDNSWPQAQTSVEPATKEAAWPSDNVKVGPPQSGSARFDDDFTDFAAAPTTGGPDDEDIFGDDKWPTPFHNFIGGDSLDADDALLARALAQDQRGQGKDIQVDFEATLSAVMAQAERVRAIPDHDKRREEAARVALALLDQP